MLAVLDRPEKKNAIDLATIDELHALCARLEQAPQTLILAGSGGVFAAGADIAELRERRAADAHAGINEQAFSRVHALPMPVIAAIDGFALGGGFELALAADIRIAGPDAVFGSPEPGLGIIAAAGATWRIAQLAGHAAAAELLLTGRSIDAAEALRLGLVSRIEDDALAAAIDRAERIARLSPAAVQATKRALWAPVDAHPAIERTLQAELFDSDEKEQRMTAFLERKAKR